MKQADKPVAAVAQFKDAAKRAQVARCELKKADAAYRAAANRRNKVAVECSKREAEARRAKNLLLKSWDIDAE